MECARPDGKWAFGALDAGQVRRRNGEEEIGYLGDGRPVTWATLLFVSDTTSNHSTAGTFLDTNILLPLAMRSYRAGME